MMRWDDEQYLSKDRMDSKKVRLILFRLTGGAVRQGLEARGLAAMRYTAVKI